MQYIPSQIGVGVLSFLSVPILTRLLSIEDYGQYALVLSSVTILVTLINGLGPAIVRFYPAVAEADVEVLVRTLCWAQLAIGASFATLALVVTRVVWAPEVALQQVVDLGILIFALQSTFSTFTQVLRARLHGGLFSVFVLANKVASLLLGIALVVYWQLGVTGVLWGVALGFASCLPFLWREIFAGMSPFGQLSISLLGELMRYGLPVGLGNLGTWVLNRADRYLIQLFYGLREVGLYAVAYSISLQSIVVLGVLFRIASGPLLTTTWEKEGVEATQRLLASVTRLYLLVAIPAVVGVSVLAKPILQVLVGAEYAEAYPIIPWVVGGAFFLGLESRFNHVLLLFKRPRLVMLCAFAAGLLNVGLNAWLLPRFGYHIAAMNTLVCYMVLCGLEAYLSQFYLRWAFPWRTTVRSLASAVVMGLVLAGVLRGLTLSAFSMLSVSIPLGIIIYGGCLWGGGEFSSTERRALSGRGRRWLTQQWAR